MADAIHNEIIQDDAIPILIGAKFLISTTMKALSVGRCWLCGEREEEYYFGCIGELLFCKTLQYFVYLATAAVNTGEYRLLVVEIYSEFLLLGTCCVLGLAFHITAYQYQYH